MSEINYKQLLLKLIREHDPTIDLADDSPIVVDVINPMLEALNHDPYAANISKFIRTRMQQELGLDIRDGTFLEDILDKGGQVLLEPYRREVHRLGVVQSLLNQKVMTDGDIDAFSANRFIVRDPGEFAYIRIRVYKSAPMDEEVQPDNLARANSGLVFIPTQVQRISKTQMSLQKEGSYYYWDLTYVAAEPGEQYNITQNSIASVDGLQYIRVTNTSRASFGANQDSNDELLVRAAAAQSQASLVSDLGIAHTLGKEFEGQLRLVMAVGRNDPEMQRDIITANGDFRAQIQTWVQFPFTVTPANHFANVRTDAYSSSFFIPIAAYTNVFDIAGAINTAWLGAGGNSYLVTPWVNGSEQGIYWHSDSIVLGDESEIEILSIASDMYSLFLLDVGGSANLSSKVGVTYSGGQSGTLSLDGIPGGILRPNTPDGNIVVPGNSVHVGAGAIDLYTVPRTVQELSWALPVTEDADPDVIKDTMSTSAGSTSAEITNVVDWNAINVWDVIYIYAGSDTGTYTVLEKHTAGPLYYVRLDAPATGLTATAVNVQWSVVADDDIDVSTATPFRVIVRSSGMSGLHGHNIITDLTKDFTALGVALGHDVIIEGGDNVGSYTVAGIISATSLYVGQAMPADDANMSYKIVNRYTPITLPVREIKDIQLIDSTGRPTGSVIPYAYPVDVRIIDAFSNLGVSPKIEDGVLNTTVSSTLVSSADFSAVSPAVDDRIVVTAGDNKGYYRVTEIVTGSSVRVDKPMTATSTTDVFNLGAPSVGTARLYFLDKVSFEAFSSHYDEVNALYREGTLFSYQASAGGPVYEFEPGFTDFDYQIVPDPATTVLPSTLDQIGATQVQLVGSDFNALGVEVGNRLYIYSGPDASISSYQTVTHVGNDILTVSPGGLTNPIAGVQFKIVNPGTQGIDATSIEDNVNSPFYYVDIEMNSLGLGSAYNLDAGTKLGLDMTSSFYKEGWYMESANENLSFSNQEDLHIRFTRRFLETGLPAYKTNRTLLQGSGIRILYNNPDLINDMSAFMRSAHRVICSDPLIRHLVPTFVYMNTDYTEGSSEAVIRIALKRYIENLPPEEDLTVFNIIKQFRKYNVSDITGPLQLVGIVWGLDRTIEVDRSLDRISPGRNSAFIVHDGVLSDVRRT